jgi:hypothetical protein
MANTTSPNIELTAADAIFVTLAEAKPGTTVVVFSTRKVYFTDPGGLRPTRARSWDNIWADSPTLAFVTSWLIENSQPFEVA